jgi:hypothetical protein
MNQRTLNNVSDSVHDKGVGGAITGGVNLGLGAPVFKQIVGSTMEFRTLLGGEAAQTQYNGTDISINCGAQNLGAGVGQIFAGNAPPYINLRSLKSGFGISISQSSTEIEIASLLSRQQGYYQPFGQPSFGQSFDVNGVRATSFIAPYTRAMSEFIFFNVNGTGTHYPVSMSIYETSNPLDNAPTYTRIYQGSSISMTTTGYKVQTAINTVLTQYRGYFVCLQRLTAGGTTAPNILGTTNGFNNSSANISSTDTNSGSGSPASFSINISSNTVSGLTTGTATANAFWWLATFSF